MATSPDLTHAIALVGIQPFAWGMTPRVRQKKPIDPSAAGSADPA